MPERLVHDPENKSSPTGEDGLLHLREARDAALQAAREAVRDTTRLTRLITALNDSGPLNLLLERVLSTLSELFLADIVVLLDPVGTGIFSPLAAIGLPEDVLHVPFSDEENGYTKRLMHTQTPVLIRNAGADRNVDSQLRDLGAESIVGLPVDGASGVGGALFLARCSPNPFTDAETDLLKTMAYRIGRTLVEAQRSVQFEKIVQSGRELSQHLDPEVVACETTRMLPSIVNADASVLVLNDPKRGVYCAAHTDPGSRYVPALVQFGESLVKGMQVGKGELYSTDDMATALARLSPKPPRPLPEGALLAIPIHRKELIHGMLFAIRFSPISFNSGTQQIATLYAEQVSAAIENALLYQTVQNELAERKRLEAEQRKWERQQQQLQKATSLNSMAGAIAHHFNNQLGAVMGNLEMAIEDLPPGGETVRLLTASMQSARKAVEVSTSMLTYLGQKTGIRTVLDVSEVCRKSLPLLRTAAPQGVVVRTNPAPRGLMVNADASQLQQVLTNFVTNAWEAVGDRPETVDLTVKLVSPAEISTTNRFPVDWRPQADSYACIEVADRGCGIAEEDIEKLFDPFFSHKFTGRGLGLAVVLGIAKAHGGVITVESTKGRGSTFRFFLPVSRETVPGRSVGKVEPSTAYNGTVLLIEDEEMVREMATAMLKRLGFNVLAAQDGPAALEVFRKQPSEIRVVICDLSMPRMNGWKTISALRQIRANIPVVLASGHDESKVLIGEHPDIPYQGFLHKPYEKAVLKKALLRAMEYTGGDGG